MNVHLVNPSHVSFGVGVITPRWLFVLAAATPADAGDPILVDETLEVIDFSTISSGDIVGIGIHTGNALRGYEVGRTAKAAKSDKFRKSMEPRGVTAEGSSAAEFRKLIDTEHKAMGEVAKNIGLVK